MNRYEIETREAGWRRWRVRWYSHSHGLDNYVAKPFRTREAAEAWVAKRQRREAARAWRADV